MRYACDIEHTGTDVSYLAGRLFRPEPNFLQSWVCTEVLAKLHDTPILKWLKMRGMARAITTSTGAFLEAEGAEVYYFRNDTLFCYLAFGRKR